MNDRELLLRRWKIERPMFVKMLRALPEKGMEYRPHERSNTAARIAWILPEEVRALAEIVEKGESHWEGLPPPASFAEMADAFERNADRLTELLIRTDDAKWESEGKFLAGGQVVFAGPVRDHCWWVLFDLVHHRGQLSTYIRPMGGQVPAVYGPSADDQTMPEV
jgi:uncharacterized damage-inducible protein DinB